MNRFIYKAKILIRNSIRGIYLFFRRIGFKNKTISIVCNNCCGGVIYNQLKCRFNSPFINLDIDQEDFIFLLLHLEEYLKLQIKEIKNLKEYPVGEFVTKGTPLRPIKIYFVHYKSFDEAVNKWNERKKRIDFKNLYVVFDVTSRVDLPNDIFVEYKKVQYPKIILSDKNIDDLECALIDFRGKPFRTGRILHYYSFFKRFIDQFDYKKFLN